MTVSWTETVKDIWRLADAGVPVAEIARHEAFNLIQMEPRLSAARQFDRTNRLKAYIANYVLRARVICPYVTEQFLATMQDHDGQIVDLQMRCTEIRINSLWYDRERPRELQAGIKAYKLEDLQERACNIVSLLRAQSGLRPDIQALITAIYTLKLGELNAYLDQFRGY